MTETRKLSVVKKPKPEDGQSLLNPTTAPAVRGEGEGAGALDYTCGGCGVVLLASIEPGSVSNFVIKCPECGIHNRTLD